MTLAELRALLDSLYGITAERKSLYDDMETLRAFGYDIVAAKSKTTAYYLGERKLELAELKLLVDAVQSSRFVTKKKSDELIRKLSDLASEHNARALARQVHIANRVKTMNESIYYNVDYLHTAILTEKQIRFRYFSWNDKKEKVFRRDGAYYTASPYALTWDSENYYLIAFDSEKQELRHYRVDKMTGITVTDAHREGEDAFRHFDLAGYTHSVFDMFAGEKANVTLRVASHLAGVIIDRFGADIAFMSDEDGFFRVNLPVAVSPTFFGWLFGFGAEMEILTPPAVRDAFRAHIEETLAKY